MEIQIRAWVAAVTPLLGGSLLAALMLPPAWGQVADDTANDEVIEVIVVTVMRRDMPAEALPNTVRLIDQGEITEQLLISTNVLDVISTRVPSFAPSRQKLTSSGVTFRGHKPLFMIDGVPQSNPLRNGARDGSTIDPAVIQRIEVLYGANAIQGVGATGGIVNYVTVAPTNEDRWESHVELGVTSAGGFDGDGYDYRGSATGTRDFGAVDLVLSVATESRGIFYDADERRIGVDAVQGDIQDSESLNLFGKIGWDIDTDTRLQFTFNAFDLSGNGDYEQIEGDRDAGIPAISVKGAQQGVAPENKVRTFSLNLTRNALFDGRLTAQAFVQDFEAVFGGDTFETFQDPAFAPADTLFDQSANNSEKYGLKIAYSHDDVLVPGLQMTAGADYLRDSTFQELVQTGRLWVPETEFRSLAPFVQLDYELADGRARLSAGGRKEFATLDVDTYQTLAFYGSQTVGGGKPDFSEALFNVGGSVDVLDGLTVYASFAEGFTMPDVGRVLRGVNSPGQDVDSLLSLEPIIVDNIEVGVTIEHGNLRANASYFWSDSDLGQRLSANADGIFEVNRERTEAEGVELAIEWQASESMTIGGNFAALEGRFDADDDGNVDSDLSASNISPDRLNLFADVQPTDRLSGRLQLSHFFDRNFDDVGAETDFDGYTLVDLLFSYDLHQFGRIDLGIQNALDEDYFTYYSQSATARNDRFFAGRGRTITARWSSEF